MPSAGQTRSSVKSLDPDNELRCDVISGLSNTSLPTAYVITPTYARLTQEVDLLRMCYTLGHTTGVHWILVEDNENKTSVVCSVCVMLQLHITIIIVLVMERNITVT